jgi:hypothetical protein
MPVRPQLPSFAPSSLDYTTLDWAPPDSAPPYCAAPGSVSPLLLADRMLTLARHADRAGLAATAGGLVNLAHTVFDEARFDEPGFGQRLRFS